MSDKNHISGSLGPVSSNFLNTLSKQGKTIFTLDDAVLIYDKSRQQCKEFLRDLCNRKVIARIRPGVYLVISFGKEIVQLTQWPVIARELVGGQNYFISHYSAMRLHGMTTHPLLTVFITMTKQQSIREVQNIKYQFIYCQQKYFWGVLPLWVSKQEKVCVSDLERTILDALDRPSLCGGIKEVIHGIWSKHNEIHYERLIAYAKKFRTKAAVKRLGFILEMLNIGAQACEQLLLIVEPSKDYILVDPDGPNEGKYFQRWHVQININSDEMKAGL